MYKLWGDVDEEQWIEDEEAFIKLEIGDELASECPECGAWIEDGSEHEEKCENKEWRPEGPRAWCNGAGIRVSEEDDSVTVSISVGDPRGAFAFTVRKLRDGTLIMHTPYPGEGLAHMRLEQMHEGTYKIVGG